ncbi:MAG: LCP family protein [Lachnospiraceae bacterium]|nr:LCP family protein [Lachnospiraceae bacterium]
MNKNFDDNDIFDEDEFIGDEEFEDDDPDMPSEDEEDDLEDDVTDQDDPDDEFVEENFDDEEDIPDENDEFTELDFDEESSGVSEDADIPAEPKKYDPDDYTEDDFAEFPDEIKPDISETEEGGAKKKRGLGLAGRIVLVFLAVIVVFAGWTLGTKSGRTFALSIVSKFISSNAGKEDEVFNPITADPGEPDVPTPEFDGGELVVVDESGQVVEQEGVRHEDYVKTYLLFGIEEIDGAANTDALLLVSVNTKDNTIKMVSILRDTYVEIPNANPNKINSVYAKGARGATTAREAHENGAALLVRVIEDTFKIDISGWACVNFNSFEKIVDRLGGIDIELGKSEAAYLCTSNYISNPAYRTVKEGWNHLNGNQVVGYCRVRHKPTLGGAANDYGRTVRHRRVINAIINKYKSSALTELLPILRDCVAYVYTSLSEEEMTQVMSMVIENKIFTTNSLRIPVDGGFYDSGKSGIYNGYTNIKYTLVMGENIDKNIKALYEFVFLDEEETVTPEGEVSPAGEAPN